MAWKLANIDGRAALVIGEGVYDLEKRSDGTFGADPMAALSRPADLAACHTRLVGTAPDAPLIPEALGPPVPNPQKVFGIGLNYRTHAEETGMELPELPLVFTKFPSCLVGPAADIVLSGDRVDWEVELVAVIGRGGRHIDAADGWDHVAGVTVGQDISDRRVQMAHKPPQFSMGKSFDTYGPIGPFVVAADGLEHRDDLHLTCDVGGERMQDGRTSDLIFSVPELVAHLSAVCTLVAGDLIFTGTPSGVGAARKRFLQPGETVTSTISGIGTLANRCVTTPGT